MDWTDTTMGHNTPITSRGDEEFRKRMESLKPMERKTAQAFLDRGLCSKYKWPSEN